MRPTYSYDGRLLSWPVAEQLPRERAVLAHVDTGWEVVERLNLVLPDERKRILAGDHSPLIREQRPHFLLGDVRVLAATRPQRSYAESVRGGTGEEIAPAQVLVTPGEELVAIRITAITPRKAGGWSVRFDVIDRRQPKRLLRSKPPVFDADLMKRDQVKPPDSEEEAEAREESNYTGNPAGALDAGVGLDDVELKVVTDNARRRWESGRVGYLEDRANQPVLERLRLALLEAREQKVNVSSRVRVIERQVQLIESDLVDRRVRERVA